MKKVLIISTSPRKGGNSDMLAQEFAKGALEAGNEVEIVSLAGRRIEFCRGCLTCGKTQRCVIDDDATEVRERMLRADVIVWATPVYYYSCSGQMKTMIDRANPLYSSDYQFREVYLLAAAAEDEPHTVEGTVKAAQGWVDCFEKAALRGGHRQGRARLGGLLREGRAPWRRLRRRRERPRRHRGPQGTGGGIRNREERAIT